MTESKTTRRQWKLHKLGMVTQEVILLKNFVRERVVEGEPVQAGEVSITPVSRAWIIQLPGWLGGFTWNRPEGVKVRAPGQFEKYLPVRDLTRYVIWTIFGAALSSMLVMLLLRRRRR